VVCGEHTIARRHVSERGLYGVQGKPNPKQLHVHSRGEATCATEKFKRSQLRKGITIDGRRPGASEGPGGQEGHALIGRGDKGGGQEGQNKLRTNVIIWPRIQFCRQAHAASQAA
jgi:hypothetical protein